MKTNVDNVYEPVLTMSMAGYTKLFSTIVTSTIWREPKETKILWITMLALSNKEGVVEGSVPGLAHLAGLTIEEAEVSLRTLSNPDPYSRSKELDGVRIKEVEGGWMLVNHAKYRALLSAEERREYLRKKQAEYRSKQPSTDVSDKYTPSTHTEAKADTDTDSKTQRANKSPRFVFTPPIPQEVTDYSESIGYPMNGEAWCDAYAQKGWMVGKNKMKDWRAAVRNWKSQKWQPSLKSVAYKGVNYENPLG